MKHQITLAVSGHKVSAIKMPNIIVGNVYLEDLATLKFILKTINKNNHPPPPPPKKKKNDIGRNGYCSRDIYLLSVKISRSVISRTVILKC